MEGANYARRYRPTSLNDYIGNEGLVDTIRRYIKNKRPQTILLSGNTGCGKTTMARLIVKEYLCEDWSYETGACGKCAMCQAVDEYIQTGSSELLPDVYEVDVTDKSGKRDMDALLETVEYPALNGWKVYVMDEYQQSTAQAQARILKVEEEPPENVLFIFCTTDPQKLLDTVRNRCQLQLQVQKPSLTDLVKLLKRVCLSEGKDYDVEGLRMIASRADFVIRDALNNLERVVETRGSATAESVSEEFNEISDSILFEFFNAYKSKDYLGYVSLLYKIKTTYNFGQFLISLTNFTLRGIYIINGVDVEGISANEIKAYARLFREFSPKDISFILSSLKKMSVGDVEANLMAFIYTEPEEKSIEEGSVEPRPVQAGVSEEESFRNRVLAKQENAKLERGTAGLAPALKEVSISDALSQFNVEKVSRS